MRRSSLRRSSVVALASASVGLAAPIPDPSILNLFGGQISGQSSSQSSGLGLSSSLSSSLNGNALNVNGLISSLTNFVGSAGSLKAGVNVQAQIEDIFKSFGLSPTTGASATAATGSISSSVVPSPTASPKGSISGISAGASGTVNLGNIVSAGTNIVKQVESAVNGIASSGNAAVGFSNPFGSAGVQVGAQASVSPSASPRIPSPTASPVIPTISASIASPSPIASPSGAASVGVSAQVGVSGAANAGQNLANAGQNIANAGQNLANGIAKQASNVVAQVESQVKGITNTATSIGKDATASAVKSAQSATSSPVAASASVGVTGSTSVTTNNPLSGLTNLLGGSSSNNILGTNFGSLLNPSSTKSSGSGLTSLFQFGGLHI